MQTLKTGLSDFHKLTLTVLKIHYEKQKPEIFRSGFLSEKGRQKNCSFADFHSKFLYVLGKHAPI